MPDQEPVWVRITSDDGFSFLLDKRAVECSATLRDMVDASDSQKHNQRQFPLGIGARFLSGAEASADFAGIASTALLISAAVVEKLIEYLNFRYLFKDTTKPQDIPDFSKRIPPEIVLEV